MITLYQVKIPKGVTEMLIDSGEGEPVTIPVEEGKVYPLTCTEEGIGLNSEQISPTCVRVSKIPLAKLFEKKPKE